MNELFSRSEVGAALQPGHRSAYPTGSTFKIITALAALENGEITPHDVDRRQRLDQRRRRRSSKTPAARSTGRSPWSHALQVSSDVYFYTLGLKMWDTNELQQWSRTSWGSASRPGSTCPASAEGLVPSKKWRDELFAEGGTERPWSAGDNIQLAIGQGDLQTNPLQMAIAYAALGNGGTIVTPHLGMEVEDAAGRVLKEIDPGPRAPRQDRPRLPRRRSWKGCTRRRRAAAAPPTGVFGGFPIPSRARPAPRNAPATATSPGTPSLAPYPNPRIVTVVTIEEGGFGAESAAPGRAADPRSVFPSKEGERELEARANGGEPADRCTRPATRQPAPSRSHRASASASGSASPTWTGR